MKGDNIALGILHFWFQKDSPLIYKKIPLKIRSYFDFGCTLRKRKEQRKEQILLSSIIGIELYFYFCCEPIVNDSQADSPHVYSAIVQA